MPFNKETAAVAGRKSSRKNVPNEKSLALKGDFLDFVEKDKGDVFEIIRQMEPEKRVYWTYKFAQLVIPKSVQNSVEQNFDNVVIDMTGWK